MENLEKPNGPENSNHRRESRRPGGHFEASKSSNNEFPKYG